MKRKFLLVNSTTTSGTVTKQKIGEKEYFIISGAGSMVGNTVMNGIYYPLEEVEKLAASNVGRIPAPVSHPRSEDKNYISATDQVAQNDYGIGAFSYNYRMDGDRLIRDIAVPVQAGLNADKHSVMVERINNHEDVDTSTGVMFEPMATNGVGKDGEEYSMVAKNMMLDHDALLPFETGASTTLMGTGMFANSAGDTSEVFEYNASMPAMNLPLAPVDTQWSASDADSLIREYTGSEDEPSSIYRRYFLYFDRSDVKNYTAYKLPFATIIDGRPHAVLSAINNAASRLSQTDGLSDSDKAKAQRVIDHYQAKADKMKTNSSDESWVKRNLKLVMNKLGINPETETHEDNSMDLIKAALNEAGIKTEGLTDAELYAAHNKLIIANAMKEGGKDKTELSDEEKAKAKKPATNSDNAELMAAINALTDKVTAMETAANSSKEADLNEAAKKVVALNKGIDETAAKAMGLEACNAFLAKNAGFVNTAFNAYAPQFATNGDNSVANMEAPE